jgi:hypothetical protein
VAKVEVRLTPWTADHATREGEAATTVAATHVVVDGVIVPPARARISFDYFGEVTIVDTRGLGLRDYLLSEIISVEHLPVDGVERLETVLTLPISELVVLPPA